MKLKDGLILREVAGQYVIVPTGKRVQEVTGVLYITKPAAYLWDYMQENEFEKEDLIKMTLEHYSDATREQVSADIDKYIEAMSHRGLLDDGSIHGSFRLQLPKEK